MRWHMPAHLRSRRRRPRKSFGAPSKRRAWSGADRPKPTPSGAMPEIDPTPRPGGTLSISRSLQALAVVVVVLIVAATVHQLLTGRAAILADTEHQMARLDMVFAEQTGRAVETVTSYCAVRSSRFWRCVPSRQSTLALTMTGCGGASPECVR